MFHLVSSKAIINSIHVIIKYFLNKKLSVICIWELKWSSFVLPGPRGGNFHQASCVWIWEPAQAQRLQFWSGTTCLSPNKTKIVNFLMIYMLFIYSLLNYLLRKTKNFFLPWQKLCCRESRYPEPAAVWRNNSG